ncbi:MAG: aminomethyltransferase family protein [Myxococcota bacterium]|nr:aminomethyltransferase family protein [Myxococcota bacterium]
MPEKTPFFDRQLALCDSFAWKQWAGQLAVVSYATSHYSEYIALRHACGLLDVSPLYKYDIRGADAAQFLSRSLTRSVSSLAVGRVVYTCWCTGDGRLVDDGTVTRLSDTHFRLTAAEPSLVWFERLRGNLDVEIVDVSRTLAALALQGPTSAACLASLLADDINSLRFFRAMQTSLADVPVTVTRTGYTGDLGYEIWLPAEDAHKVWDAIVSEGRNVGLLPVGLAALDMVRVEAGYVMAGVDFHNARHCIVPSQTSSPFELGLDWTVELEREPFVGQSALRKERAAGSAWALVGLDIAWDELEALYEVHNLPALIPAAAWRHSVPVFAGRAAAQVGYASSGTWSPLLKKNLALAHVRPSFAVEGTRLDFEVTVEHERHTVPATVVQRPFYNPSHARQARPLGTTGVIE